MRQRSWSRLLRIVAVVAVAATATLAVDSPAQAYTCSGARSLTITNTTGVSRASIVFYPECSDNKAHWSGTVWDILCDDRAARVSLVANQAYGYWQWEAGPYVAGNGCGSSSTYTGSAASVIDYAGLNWRVDVYVGACNFWSCASYTVGYLHH